MKKDKRAAGWQEDEQNPSQKIEFDLEDDDVEGIIDLDDILEVDDEDQLDLDVEILDADAELDVDELSTDLSDDDDDLLASDFLEGVSPTEDETLPLGLGKSISLEDEDDDEIEFDSLLNMDMDDDEASRIAEEMVGEDMQVEAPAIEPTAEAVSNISESLEAFVSQIEERLVESVRLMVEEKLPDIVRSLLEEHIEKLKRELH